MWAHALRRRNPAPGEQLRKLTSALVRAIGGASLKVDQCRREIPTRCLTSAIMEHFGPSPPSTASGAFIEHHRRAALNALGRAVVREQVWHTVWAQGVGVYI